MTAVLLPYQQRWIADRSQVKIVEKSRRVGLSWGEAANAALEAAKSNGQDTWYIGYTRDMAEEFIIDVGFWARHFQAAAETMEQTVIEDEGESILAFRVRFASGHRVTALSSSPRNLRGKQGRVVIDEAAFHPQLTELLKSAFALLIWGGSVSVISTHNGVDNPFNELVQDIRAGKKPYSLHRVLFDEAVEQGLCQRVFQSTGKAWSPEAEAAWCDDIRAIYRPNDAEELDCIPSQSGGAYLSRALIEQRMVDSAPVLRLTCPEGFDQKPDIFRAAEVKGWIDDHVKPIVRTLPTMHKSSIGLDFGRSGDLSVIAPLLEGQSLKRDCPFMIEMRNVPFKQQEQVLFWLCDNLPRFGYGALDARGNGQYLAEVAMQRYGSASIAQVMLSNPWYLENMPKLKAAFEDGDLASLPKDRDVLDDLRALVVEKGIPKLSDKAHSKSQDGGQRHGDAAIALALAWFASAQGGGPMEYIAVPLRAPVMAGERGMQMRAPRHEDVAVVDSRRDW